MEQSSVDPIRTRKVTHTHTHTHTQLIQQQCIFVFTNLYCIEIAQFKIWNFDHGELYPWVLLENVKYPRWYLAVEESGRKLTAIESPSEVNSYSV